MTGRTKELLRQIEAKQRMLVGRMRHKLSELEVDLNLLAEDHGSRHKAEMLTCSTSQLYELSIQLQSFNMLYQQMKDAAERADAEKDEKIRQELREKADLRIQEALEQHRSERKKRAEEAEADN